MDANVELLADHPEVLPVLIDWFEREWAPYYGPSGPGEASLDLGACLSRDALPIGLVAFAGGELVGTAALKDRSITTHPHLTPWLAALLVAPNHRRRGVGTTLVTAVERLAAKRGFERLYVGVDEADGLVTRLGWRFIERGPYFVSDVSIFFKQLEPDLHAQPGTA